MTKRRRIVTGQKTICDKWAVPLDREFDIGEDCIFIEERESGDEVWFHLRDDFFNLIMDAAESANPPPWVNLIEAYEIGLGRWGDEPWRCPDVFTAVSQIISASDNLAKFTNSDQVMAAHQDLIVFLRGVLESKSTLWVDDGSGEFNRFPLCE